MLALASGPTSRGAMPSASARLPSSWPRVGRKAPSSLRSRRTPCTTSRPFNGRRPSPGRVAIRVRIQALGAQGGWRAGRAGDAQQGLQAWARSDDGPRHRLPALEQRLRRSSVSAALRAASAPSQQHQLRRGRDAQNERDGAGLRSSDAAATPSQLRGSSAARTMSGRPAGAPPAGAPCRRHPVSRQTIIKYHDVHESASYRMCHPHFTFRQFYQ